MQQIERPVQLVRFGVYEADLRSGELRKNGLKLKLSGQPFHVLALLLERAGDVVTRDEIQKRLWTGDTFVDFDHGLNTAINKIREVLGDAADNPCFVETLPRRGYRFMAPVEGIVLGASSPLPKVSPDGKIGGDDGKVSLQRWPNARIPPLGARRILRPGAIVMALAVGASIAWYAWERSRPKPALTERRLTANSSEIPVSASAISPDGRYLAYGDAGGIHLKVIDTAETHDLQTPVGSRINNLSWFPQGNKLLASVEAGDPAAFSLWTISILGGAPQKLRDDAWDGNVFQDGTGSVFVSGKSKEIWQMGPQGDEARKLITASAGESYAMPAVAKGRLWYEKLSVGEASFEFQIESRELSGGPPTILVSHLTEIFAFLLLPNGRFIYSRTNQPGLFYGGSTWEIRADVRTGLARSTPRRLSESGDFEVFRLSSTADGKRLAFLKERTSLTSVYVGELQDQGSHIMNPQRLTLSDSFDHAYAWTPDSRSVLFDSNRNGTWDVFKQSLDQRAAEKLVANPGSHRPAMSPDGGSVLYLTFNPAGYYTPCKIMRVALAGGPPQSLGEIQSNGEIRCALKANLCLVGEYGPERAVFYALDPVKGKGRELSRISHSPLPGSDKGWDVSPDGSSLAFLRDDVDKGAFQIQIQPLAGGRGRELNIDGWTNVHDIRWTANGKGWYITTAPSGVTTLRLGDSTLLKVDLSGNAQQLMQGFAWADAIPSPDGRHVAMMGRLPAGNVWMLENF